MCIISVNMVNLSDAILGMTVKVVILYKSTNLLYMTI